jgi:hypothetical protein
MRKMLALVILSAQLFGCSIHREVSDLKSSGVVLYPVTKTGDLLGFLGKGLRAASTPFDQREKKYSATISVEQKKVLDLIAVPYDGTWSIDMAGGAGFGAGQFSEPLRSQLLRAESLVGYSFDWYLNPQLPDGAMAFPGGVIVLNPQVLSHLSTGALQFVLAHEEQHQVRGHVTPAGIIVGMQQPWLTQDRESEADVEAARSMLAAGYPPQFVVYSLFEVLGNAPPNASHRSGPERIAIVRTQLGI